MDRDKFIKAQAGRLDEVFSFTRNENEARARFERLALDSYDFLKSMNTAFYWGFNPTRWPFKDYFGPPELMQRWRDWEEEYKSLRRRNPRLELYDVMHEISESHNASSWPDGREGRIQSWVDAGDPRAEPPFDDRHGIVTDAFFNRLRELRQSCGGWLYWNNDLRRVVFAPETEWQKIRAAQDAKRAQVEKMARDNLAVIALFEKRSSELLAAARGDNKFWGALKQWELAREAKRPGEPAAKPPPPKVGQLSGPIRLVSKGVRQITSEEKYKLDNPPLDPIFADFVVRFRLPDDVLIPSIIVGLLRHAVREELGLDSTLTWSGGPSVGVSSS